MASAKDAAASVNSCSEAVDVASAVFPSISAWSADFSCIFSIFVLSAASFVIDFSSSSSFLISFTSASRSSSSCIFSLGTSAIASDSEILSMSAFLASSRFSNAVTSRGSAFSLRSSIDEFSFKASLAACISGVDFFIASDIEGATSDNSSARKSVRSASSPCFFASSKDLFSASVLSLFSTYCLLA